MILRLVLLAGVTLAKRESSSAINTVSEGETDCSSGYHAADSAEYDRIFELKAFSGDDVSDVSAAYCHQA